MGLDWTVSKHIGEKGKDVPCCPSYLASQVTIKMFAESIRTIPSIQGDVYQKITLYKDDVLVFISNLQVIDQSSKFSSLKMTNDQI